MRFRSLALASLAIAAAAALGVVVAPRSLAQSQKAAAEQPAFDVASVKIDDGGIVAGAAASMRGGPGTSDPGRFTITRQPLKAIVTRAYDVLPDQVYGPPWLDDTPGARFTITATMPPDTTKEQFQIMWQNLLAERFHLILYHETRDFPAYDLAVAPGGPKLKEWTPDPNVDSAAAGPGGRDEQGFPRLRPGLPGSATSFAVRRDGMPSMIRETHRQSMAEFAKGLGASLNRANAQPIGAATPRVTDKTGLTGVYEFRLEFEGTVALPGPPAPALFPGDAAPVAGDPGEGGLSLFTALQKQLGLKLVKAKSVPVDVLVIDHADRTPTEN